MKIPITSIFVLWISISFAQFSSTSPEIHSHNDYLQETPLLNALNAGAKSIEIDVFFLNDSLFVAHTKREIVKSHTLTQLYLLPLKKYLSTNKNSSNFHLMIDIKTEPVSSLNAIQMLLKQYPAIFSHDGIQVIISGNRPKAKSYASYADFIWFDARSPAEAKGPGAGKTAMISQNLSKFTTWRGKGSIAENEKAELLEFINQAHSINKPVRLWNSGDSEATYKFLCSMGVDYINTDHPKALRNFLNSYKHE